MEKDMLDDLASNAMFAIKPEEKEEFQVFFEEFLDQVEMINRIDTTDVEPQDFPFLTKRTYLREDVVSHQATKEEVLSNAFDVEDDQIRVPVVVKR